MLESEPGSPGLQVTRVALSRKFYQDARECLSEARKAEGHEELGWKRALHVVRQSLRRTAVSKCIASLMVVAKVDDTLGIHEEVETLRKMRNRDESTLFEDMHRPIRGIIQKSFGALDLSQEKADSVEERRKVVEAEAEAEADTYSSALKHIQESLIRLDDDLVTARHGAAELRRSIGDLEASFASIGITMERLMVHVQDTLQAVEETGGVYEHLPGSSASESEDSKEAVLSDSSDAEVNTDSRTKPMPLNRSAVKAVTRFRRTIVQNRLSGLSDSQRFAMRALSKVQSLVRAFVTNQFLLRLQSGNTARLVQEFETYLGSVGQERMGAQEHGGSEVVNHGACTVERMGAHEHEGPEAMKHGACTVERMGVRNHEVPEAMKHGACTVGVCRETMDASRANAQSIQAPSEILASPVGKNAVGKKAGPSVGRQISWVREEMMHAGVLPENVPLSELEAFRRAHSSSHKLSLDHTDATKLADLLQARREQKGFQQPVQKFSGIRLKHGMRAPGKNISSQTLLDYSFGLEQKATIPPREIAHAMGRNPALSHAIGRHHTVIVQDDGIAVAHGQNAEQQCDITKAAEDPEVSDLFQTELPRAGSPAVIYESSRPGKCAISAPGGDDTYTQAAAGHFHTVLLRKNGTVVARGQNAERQCNIPELGRDSTYTQVAAGDFHTVLLRSDGIVVSCGRNAERQCEIPPLCGKLMYTQVSAGRGSTVLLRSDGSAFCCGAAARSWGPVIPKQELELLGLGDNIEKLIRLMGF